MRIRERGKERKKEREREKKRKREKNRKKKTKDKNKKIKKNRKKNYNFHIGIFVSKHTQVKFALIFKFKLIKTYMSMPPAASFIFSFSLFC